MNKSIVAKSAVFAITLCGLTAGQRASAITLVGNLSEQSNGLVSVLSNSWQASPFVTGSTSYNLDSVTLVVSELSPNVPLTVSLYSTNTISGFPDSLLFAFTNPGTITANPSPITFTLPTPQLLATNTKYWVVASVASAGGSYLWDYTLSTNSSGLTGWSIPAQYTDSSNGGTTWSAGGSDPYQFSVNGSPASSPSAPAVPGPLPILGAAACWRFSRKLRAATKAHR